MLKSILPWWRWGNVLSCPSVLLIQMISVFAIWICTIDPQPLTKVLWEQWPWWPCVGSRDSVEQKQQSAHFPSWPKIFQALNLTTSFPQNLMHRFTASSRLDQPFFLLITHKSNRTWAFLFYDGQSVPLICVSCSCQTELEKCGWKECSAVHLQCVCGRVYFSWREPIGC